MTVERALVTPLVSDRPRALVPSFDDDAVVRPSYCARLLPVCVCRAALSRSC